MTTVTITPDNDAGRTIDTFKILVDTFRAPNPVSAPSNTAFAYTNVSESGIEVFFTSENVTADKTDPNDPIITGGTVNSFDIREFDNGPKFLQVFEGFNGELNAVDVYEAVLKLKADANDTEWLDVFGAFDYSMGPSRGNVIFRGFGGDDTMLGGGGNDTFDDRFGGDADVFDGGIGNDTARVGKGQSTLDGGAGVDRISFEQLSQGASGITFSMVTGNYRAAPALGAEGNAKGFEFVIGSSGNDKVIGNGAANTIAGGAGNDSVSGGLGNDVLLGGAGTDRIGGNAGADTIIGGRGRDVLTGGADQDRFDYNAAADSRMGKGALDFILDFAVGEDQIDLAGLDANSKVAGNQAFTFIEDDAFTGAAGQLRFAERNGDTLVIGDRNGDKAGDFHILLDGSKALTEGDFIL